MIGLSHDACCHCGSTEYFLVNQQGPRCMSGDFKHVPGQIKNLLCSSCGLMVNRFKMANDELGLFYNGYTKKAASEQEDDLLFSADARSVETLTQNTADFIAANLNLPARGRVLDIGCGKGALLEAFRRHRPDWQLHGVDPSAAEVRLARRKPYLHIQQGLFGQVDLGTEPFDLIAITHVLEHVPDPCKTLREINGRLALGGRVFIEVPNALDLNMFYDVLLYEHLYHFTPETLSAILESNGFASDVVQPSTSYGALRVIGRKTQDASAAAAKPRHDAATVRTVLRGMCDWHRFWDNTLLTSARLAAEATIGKRRLAMFGAGMTAAALLTYTALADAPMIGLLDESPFKIGKTLLGRAIRPLAEIETLGIDTILIATIPGSQDLVESKLHAVLSRGITIQPLSAPARAACGAAA